MSGSSNQKKKTVAQYGFDKPHTLYELFETVRSGTYILPAIQRKYVWKEKQIEMLFDSLMLKYPIGTFLIWQNNPNNPLTDKYYSCVSNVDYNQPFTQNEEIDPRDKKYAKSCLLLDGQQRLTSILIALNGNIIKKGQKKESYLYFNYKQAPSKNCNEFNNKTYIFEFLTNSFPS